jgi:hypothetical protein
MINKFLTLIVLDPTSNINKYIINKIFGKKYVSYFLMKMNRAPLEFC